MIEYDTEWASRQPPSVYAALARWQASLPTPDGYATFGDLRTSDKQGPPHVDNWLMTHAVRLADTSGLRGQVAAYPLDAYRAALAEWQAVRDAAVRASLDAAPKGEQVTVEFPDFEPEVEWLYLEWTEPFPAPGVHKDAVP